MDIVIDTAGQSELIEECSSEESSESESESEEDCDNLDTISLPYKGSLEAKSNSKNSKDDDINLDDSYLDIVVGVGKNSKKVDLDKRHSSHVEDVLKKSVILPGYEKLDAVPPYAVSKRQLMKKRKIEREKTKGKEWFNLPAPDMTEEMKHDLEVLQMRSVLDPKQFYKKNDLKVLPKYFQVGRIVENPVDFYNSRIPKKQRKRTIVEELLADAEFKRYNKRKYKEIIEEKKKKGHSKAYKHSKKLKKKNR